MYNIVVNANGGHYKFNNLTTALVFHVLNLFVDTYGKENITTTIRFA